MSVCLSGCLSGWWQGMERAGRKEGIGCEGERVRR